MPRLRHVDCSEPGITRVRRGNGFTYYAANGERLTDADVLDRIRSLGIPPAWKDVWICESANGHLQATGIDAAGRKQYLYHVGWRERRDREKFERMVEFAQLLPGVRERIAADLASADMPRERVLACAVRLLDRGFFRVGSDEYADENGGYGLATLQKEHVTLEAPDMILFDYVAKSSMRRVQSIVDADVFGVIQTLKRRRGGTGRLLAYRVGSRWVDVHSGDVNEYIKQITGGPYTAKDFRTWSATVLAALSLSLMERPQTAAGRKRAINKAVKETATYLGNTPAVCRASYIEPRVLDKFIAGHTIAPALRKISNRPVVMNDGTRAHIERAVLDLLTDTPTTASAGRSARGRSSRSSGNSRASRASREPRKPRALTKTVTGRSSV